MARIARIAVPGLDHQKPIAHFRVYPPGPGEDQFQVDHHFSNGGRPESHTVDGFQGLVDHLEKHVGGGAGEMGDVAETARVGTSDAEMEGGHVTQESQRGIRFLPPHSEKGSRRG